MEIFHKLFKIQGLLQEAVSEVDALRRQLKQQEQYNNLNNQNNPQQQQNQPLPPPSYAEAIRYLIIWSLLQL